MHSEGLSLRETDRCYVNGTVCRGGGAVFPKSVCVLLKMNIDICYGF
jgi:hypothetical protein